MTDAIVYMAKNCPYSKLAINYLKEIGVRVRAIDIGKNIRERNKIIQETNQAGIPIIKLLDRTLIGFDKNMINIVLGIPMEDD